MLQDIKNLVCKLNFTHFVVGLLFLTLIFVLFYNMLNSKSNGSNGSNEMEYFQNSGNNGNSRNGGNGNGNNGSVGYVEPDGELILYYANWCGFSRMFLPEWEKFENYAKENLSNLKVTRVLCEGGNEATCFQKGVEGYPTVILYRKDGSEETFMDDRTSDKLVQFINNKLTG